VTTNLSTREQLFSQFDDMRMSEKPEILNFSSNLADDIQLFDFSSIDYFNGDRVSGELMIRFYSRQCSLSITNDCTRTNATYF
jgi:hypothetical protein